MSRNFYIAGRAELYCDRRLALGRPSELPEHLRQAGAGRRIVMHAMRSGGYPDPADVDTEAVHLHGFRVTDPSGEEQATREAAYAEARRLEGPPRLFRMGPDGTMHEVSIDSL